MLRERFLKERSSAADTDDDDVDDFRFTIATPYLEKHDKDLVFANSDSKPKLGRFKSTQQVQSAVYLDLSSKLDRPYRVVLLAYQWPLITG